MMNDPLMDERIIRDMKKAGLLLHMSDVSLVVIKDGEIIHQRTGNGVAPFIDLIDTTDADFSGCVIGDRLLGRASAFLCRYVNASGVYAVKGTKKALAVLMVGGVLGQIDTLIPRISDQSMNGFCPFEQTVSSVNSPNEAYRVIKKKIVELDC
jgi:hypothetical protein